MQGRPTFFVHSVNCDTKVKKAPDRLELSLPCGSNQFMFLR